MTTRSPGLLHVFRLRLIVAAALLLTFAATPTWGSQPKSGTRTERAILGNDETASSRSSVEPAPSTTPSFPYPVSVSAENRRFLDQKGNVYLLKTMSSWAMAQNSTNAEITKALEGLKELGFNAVTVSPFGVHMHDSFGDRYKNKAGQSFFTGAPYDSSFGPAWSSMDWVMSEATRLQLTIVFSLFMSWGETGTVPELVKAGATNAYDFGKTVATRYANYPNIVWHVMGDFRWSYNQGPAVGLDAIYHGIKDAEGTTHRLNISEPANGSTSFDQFLSQEGPKGYQWFKQDADTVYDYGSNSGRPASIGSTTERARRPFRSSTLSRRTSTPHITKASKTRSFASATTRRLMLTAARRHQLWPRKSGGRMASPACSMAGQTG